MATAYIGGSRNAPGQRRPYRPFLESPRMSLRWVAANMRVQRTRSRSPLMRHLLGGVKAHTRLFLVVALSTAIGAGKGLALELGQRLPKAAVNLGEVLMVNPSQLEQAYLVRDDGVDYTVCSTPDRGITYFAPRGEGFKTPEGVGSGMT